MNESEWNPWHGCHKISPGCLHCYMYRADQRHGQDGKTVYKTASFNMPLRRDKNGDYKIPPGTEVFTCFTSDFFVEEADAWRPEAWQMMRERSDLRFFFITKRIDRFGVGLPADWGEGYANVGIGCTVENQDCLNYRLPIFLRLPIRRRVIVCEPLLERLTLTPFLIPGQVEQVVVGGESGPEARICHFDWVLDIRNQCMEAGVAFRFHQTGARLLKDGRLYEIPRHLQAAQARRAKVAYNPKGGPEV